MFRLSVLSVSDLSICIAVVPAAFFDPGHDRNVVTILSARYLQTLLRLVSNPNGDTVHSYKFHLSGVVFLEQTSLLNYLWSRRLGWFRSTRSMLVLGRLVNQIPTFLLQRGGSEQELLAQLCSQIEFGYGGAVDHLRIVKCLIEEVIPLAVIFVLIRHFYFLKIVCCHWVLSSIRTCWLRLQCATTLSMV